MKEDVERNEGTRSRRYTCLGCMAVEVGVGWDGGLRREGRCIGCRVWFRESA